MIQHYKSKEIIFCIYRRAIKVPLPPDSDVRKLLDIQGAEWQLAQAASQNVFRQEVMLEFFHFSRLKS